MKFLKYLLCLNSFVLIKWNQTAALAHSFSFTFLHMPTIHEKQAVRAATRAQGLQGRKTEGRLGRKGGCCQTWKLHSCGPVTSQALPGFLGRENCKPRRYYDPNPLLGPFLQLGNCSWALGMRVLSGLARPRVSQLWQWMGTTRLSLSH